MPRCNHVGIIAIICVCVLNSMVFSLQPAQALNNQNLVKNGDFSQGLVSWETGIDYPVGDYPQFYANEGRLAMDIPYNSSGYVKQELFIPFTSKAVLSLKVWGAQCRADVCIVIQNLTAYYLIEYIETEVLEGYDNIPFTRTYDITEFTGQNVTLFLWAQGRGSPTGSFAYFDDVQIEAATGKNTVITLSMKGERIAAHTTLIRLGQSIEAFGSIYPAQDAVIELEFIKPNGDQFEKTVRTDSLGRYDYTFIPDVRGVWNVSSSWLGNSQFIGACSPSYYFVVTGGESNVSFISCTINNKDIAKPEIEAKVSEQLFGWICFNLTDWYRFTQVWVVGVNSWEYNNSTEILNEWGIHGDYIGVKIASDFTNDRTVYVPFNKNDGSFTISVKWKFPSSNTTLSLITPLKEETYYIAVLSGEVVDYADLLDNEKAAIMYSETFNKTVSSIWHLNSTEWKMLLPPNSIRPEIFAIKVHVVNVDKYVAIANETINLAKINRLNATLAEQEFLEMQWLYNEREFLDAKDHAVLIINQLENMLNVLGNQTQAELTEARIDINRIKNNLDTQALNSSLNEAQNLFERRYYYDASEKAKIINALISSYERELSSITYISISVGIVIASTVFSFFSYLRLPQRRGVALLLIVLALILICNAYVYPVFFLAESVRLMFFNVRILYIIVPLIPSIFITLILIWIVMKVKSFAERRNLIYPSLISVLIGAWFMTAISMYLLTGSTLVTALLTCSFGIGNLIIGFIIRELWSRRNGAQTRPTAAFSSSSSK